MEDRIIKKLEKKLMKEGEKIIEIEDITREIEWHKCWIRDEDKIERRCYGGSAVNETTPYPSRFLIYISSGCSEIKTNWAYWQLDDGEYILIPFYGVTYLVNINPATFRVIRAYTMEGKK